MMLYLRFFGCGAGTSVTAAGALLRFMNTTVCKRSAATVLIKHLLYLVPLLFGELMDMGLGYDNVRT